MPALPQSPPPRPTWRSRLNLSRLALRHPWFTISVWIGIAVAGLLAFSSLKYALFPDVAFPIVVINATVPLDDVVETEQQLTIPLETWLGEAEQLESIESSTYPGRSVVRLSFGVGSTLDDRRRQVDYLLQRATAKDAFPPDSTYRIIPFNLNESSAISYILRGEDREALYEQASREVLPVLRKLKGVLRVELLGAVDLEDRDSPITDTPFGGPTIVRFNGEDAMALQVVKAEDANTLEVVGQVESAIEQLKQFQPDLEVELAVSQADYIREATQATIEALLLAVVLAVVIIFPFLGSWRATLITALAIPVSLLGTFIVMATANFNLETITLLALALVIGIIVDDAIVDVENIVRHIEAGEPPRRAAFHATREIGLTVSAATLTIVAVFLPVGLMGGPIGQFFKPFGITVSAAVLTSLLAARTLSPVLASLWLQGKAGSQGAGNDSTPRSTNSRTPKTKWGEADIDFDAAPPAVMVTEQPEGDLWGKAMGMYRGILVWALGRRGLVMVLAIASLGVGIWLMPLVPQGFIPQLDRGDFNITYDISPAYLEKALRSKFEDNSGDATNAPGIPSDAVTPEPDAVNPGSETPSAEPDLQGYATFLEGLNSAQLDSLKTLGRRAVRSHVVRPRQDLRDVAERYLGSRDRWTVLARINRRSGPTDIKAGESIVVLDLPPEGMAPTDRVPEESPEDQFAPLVLAESRTLVQQMEPVVQANPNVAAIYTILGERGAINQGRIYVKLKADRALHTAEVQDQVRSALPSLEGVSISVEDIKFVDTGGDKPLKVAFRGDDLQALLQLVQTVKAKLTAYPGLVDVTASGDDQAYGGRQEIQHLDGDRVAYVRANLSQGQALGQATDFVVAEAQRILPPGITLELGGDSERSSLVLGSFLRTVSLSVICILVLLLLLFRRLLDPLVVILALPLSLIGAVLGLLITRSDFGMISVIGMIFLLGLVNKNVIILVDYTNQLRRQGLPRLPALLQAGPVRLRPILMTTLSTILGMLPIALGWGAGAELRQPMAVAIIGGLIADTILSLLVVPVLYTLVDDVQGFFFGGIRRLRRSRSNP